MQRIQQALQEQRCILFGDGLVGTSIEEELNKRTQCCFLTDEVSLRIANFSADELIPASQNQGMIVLVEPDFDEVHLEALTTFIAKSKSATTALLDCKVLQQVGAYVNDEFNLHTSNPMR